MTEAVKAKKPRVINIVTMQDGSKVDFGERGKLLSSQEVTENGFKITFNIVTGAQVVYELNFDSPVSLLVANMAAFGAACKVKAGTAGIPADELEQVINEKLEEFNQGEFNIKVTGKTTSSISQLQIAYARANEIDIDTQEGLNKVSAIFAAFSKKEKSELYKDINIKLQLAYLQLEAAKALFDKAA